jgi:UDP-GlcNAc:undecaprenyl-phosphate/decaprenyl-phosphate GlcNAc-1-phosphate transferase
MPQYTMHILNAFLIAVVLIIALERVAGRLGLMDFPHGRKTHEGSVPLTGGLAMFVAFLFPVTQLDVPVNIDLGLLAGLFVLVMVGVADDLFEIGPLSKLAGQVIAVLAMVLPGNHLIGPEHLFGDAVASSTGVKVLFTVVFVVGMVNAFNMLDGLDGLAGGAAGVALIGLALVAWAAGRSGVLIHVLLLLFAVLGFLLFNMRHPWRQRAAVFMGDAGSMMLGAAIAFFAIDLSVNPERGPPLAALLWLVAVPAFDTLILIGRRLWAGHSPLLADRRHLHHMMLQAGLTSRTTTAALIISSFVLGAIGVAGWITGLQRTVLLVLLVVPFTIHVAFVLVGWRLLARFREARVDMVLGAVERVRVAGD